MDWEVAHGWPHANLRGGGLAKATWRSLLHQGITAAACDDEKWYVAFLTFEHLAGPPSDSVVL